MDKLLKSECFKNKINEIVETCQEHGNAVSVAVCDVDGKSCYVALNANGEDISFMAAQQLFDYCDKESQKAGVPIEEYAKLSYKEFTTYLNLMVQERAAQREMLDNPIGTA